MNITKKITILMLATPILLFSHGQEWWMLPFFTTYAPTDYTTHISKPSKSKKTKISKSLQFIMDNREELELEVAKGDGEKLDAIATFYPEINEKNKEIWKSRLQKHYEKIFTINKVATTDEYVDYMFKRLINDPME